MTGVVKGRALGASLERRDGPAKVTGRAPYAYERPVTDPLYLYPVLATVARGRITALDTTAAAAVEGVAAILSHANAPRLASDADKECWILQDDEVHFRGQFIGAVVAETSEAARHAAGLVRAEYEVWPHDVIFRPDHPGRYRPEVINAGLETDTSLGDVTSAMAEAAVTLDQTYTTPMEHHNALEPHTTVAVWHEEDGTGGLTLYDSNQGAAIVRQMLAPILGLDPARLRVVSPYVGGAFGSKAFPHPHVVLTALAARLTGGRPVKYALTRQQTFTQAGFRTPTFQRVRLGADAEGRLGAIAHETVTQTARYKEYAEQIAFGTRAMYAAPNRLTSHRLVPLDFSVPCVFRAPGEAPGMFALESAMDEMALACGLDPIEFRVRNEPEVDPESGLPFSTRGFVECLREGARRFGWRAREGGGARERGGRDAEGGLVGTGVAGATYPAYFMGVPSHAAVEALGGGRYRVETAAADIGTGTWTALAQIAADALAVAVEDIELAIGDSALPPAVLAGGSMGLSGWGTTVVEAARLFRERHGDDPAPGARVTAEEPENPHQERMSMHAFGAHFAEVRVDPDTGEVWVARLLGVFDVGRVVNPRTARSQLMGGMIMGLSATLHERSVVDPRFGHVMNHDLAQYHIPTHADVGDVRAFWIDSTDPYYNPMGAKGLGEIGIVGVTAAIANAAFDATGVRVRELPLTPDKFLR